MTPYVGISNMEVSTSYNSYLFSDYYYFENINKDNRGARIGASLDLQPAVFFKRFQPKRKRIAFNFRIDTGLDLREYSSFDNEMQGTFYCDISAGVSAFKVTDDFDVTIRYE